MFSLPSPRSSKLTTSAPAEFTAPLAEAKCGAARAVPATVSAAATTARMIHTDFLIGSPFGARPRDAAAFENEGPNAAESRSTFAVDSCPQQEWKTIRPAPQPHKRTPVHALETFSRRHDRVRVDPGIRQISLPR